MATDDCFRARLDAMIDLKHPLAVLPTQLPRPAIKVAVVPKLAHEVLPAKRLGVVLPADRERGNRRLGCAVHGHFPPMWTAVCWSRPTPGVQDSSAQDRRRFSRQAVQALAQDGQAPANDPGGDNARGAAQVGSDKAAVAADGPLVVADGGAHDLAAPHTAQSQPLYQALDRSPRHLHAVDRPQERNCWTFYRSIFSIVEASSNPGRSIEAA